MTAILEGIASGTKLKQIFINIKKFLEEGLLDEDLAKRAKNVVLVVGDLEGDYVE